MAIHSLKTLDGTWKRISTHGLKLHRQIQTSQGMMCIRFWNQNEVEVSNLAPNSYCFQDNWNINRLYNTDLPRFCLTLKRESGCWTTSDAVHGLNLLQAGALLDVLNKEVIPYLNECEQSFTLQELMANPSFEAEYCSREKRRKIRADLLGEPLKRPQQQPFATMLIFAG